MISYDSYTTDLASVMFSLISATIGCFNSTFAKIMHLLIEYNVTAMIRERKKLSCLAQELKYV